MENGGTNSTGAGGVAVQPGKPLFIKQDLTLLSLSTFLTQLD